MGSQHFLTAVLAVLLLSSGAASAQGRHDERSHGATAPASQGSASPKPMAGGRHDERPHGKAMKSSPEKKVVPRATDASPEAPK
jgi:hypothetical protein